MRYLGGKKQIANELASIIAPTITDTYFEPFCGGLWVSVAIAKKCKPSTILLLSDIHPDLILLYSALYRNEIELPEYVSEEMYQEYRNKKSSALRGYIGFASSFGSKWFGGYARGIEHGKIRNYVKETKNRLEKHFSILRHFNVIFTCQSYSNLSPEDSTIYCDPPYKNTTGYKGTSVFNYNEYYKTVQEWSINNHVFCSEYSMPVGSMIWEKKKHSSATINTKDMYSIERLYKI